MEWFLFIVFVIVMIIVIASGPHSAGDITGPGRSDYNVGDNDPIVPAPMDTTRNRKRRWRRKRFAKIEKAQKEAQEDAANDPDPQRSR